MKLTGSHTRLNRWILGLLWVVLTTSCESTLQNPEEGNDPIPVALTLCFDKEMPPYKEIIYETMANDGMRSLELASLNECDIRYVVRIYPGISIGSEWAGREPIKTYFFSKKVDDDFNFTTTLDIEPGDYNVLVWSDFVEPSSIMDRLYNTSDFTDIKLVGSHLGCNDTKDAFRGQCELAVEPDKSAQASVMMERPVGKYKLIATDYARFLQHLEEEARKNAELRGGPYTPEDLRIEEYKIGIRYGGFVPCAFDNFANRPSDADLGRKFESAITPINETEAELGFDYVLTNGQESNVTVSIDLHDPEGIIIASSNSIKIPLIRSHLTTIKGNFLSALTNEGIIINPEFDGEFNILIQ